MGLRGGFDLGLLEMKEMMWLKMMWLKMMWLRRRGMRWRMRW